MNTTLAIQDTKRRITTLSPSGVEEIGEALRDLLADVYALYVKTKGFHWHVSGPHFPDYHRLLDDQATQILSMVDPIAERARKLGAPSLQSIGEIAERQRLHDSEGNARVAEDMLAVLLYDNQELTGYLRSVHEVCARHLDVATASLIENWIDESEMRTWFLYAILQQ
ncbi:Dps family protein [Cerasicoccus frondis]|uniref:Dps family protein n=1 Tax=Cerasicoccus frondis TaxID=490090 RepID=UPI002852CA17|nr:DNA starvation/stationary phase protection protein [Cerasicoccus frondis]